MIRHHLSVCRCGIVDFIVFGRKKLQFKTKPKVQVRGGGGGMVTFEIHVSGQTRFGLTKTPPHG